MVLGLVVPAFLHHFLLLLPDLAFPLPPGPFLLQNCPNIVILTCLGFADVHQPLILILQAFYHLLVAPLLGLQLGQ